MPKKSTDKNRKKIQIFELNHLPTSTPKEGGIAKNVERSIKK
jgi:hypothetical protein